MIECILCGSKRPGQMRLSEDEGYTCGTCITGLVRNLRKLETATAKYRMEFETPVPDLTLRIQRRRQMFEALDEARRHVTMKLCARCKEEKPRSTFHKMTRALDGLQPWCKTCGRDGNRKYFRENPEKVAEYNRRTKEKFPDLRRQRDANRKKQLMAYRAVQTAVRNGTLVRSERCSACKKKREVEAHHENYDKRLDVIWLCHECHGKVHWKEKQTQPEEEVGNG